IGKEQDARFKELFDAATGDSPPPNFIVENGVLWLHHEGTTEVSLYIPDVNHRGIKLQESLLENAHTQHGHNGGQRLYESLKNSIFWEGMRKDCIDYVKQCHSCQISKPSNQKPLGSSTASLFPKSLGNQWVSTLLAHFKNQTVLTALW